MLRTLNMKLVGNDEQPRHLDVLKKYGINMQQELFCQYYVSPTEFYGNGVQSYAAAYNLDIGNPTQYNSAKARASILLSQVNIMTRINDLIEHTGFNDENADKQLYFLLMQSADFHAKLGAIKEYNKLKKRIVERLENVGDTPIAQINLIPISIPNREEPREVEATVVESQTEESDPEVE